MTVSERIEFLRKERGVTLTHLNKVLGAYRGKLTDVRNGKASLNEKEIAIISEELSTSVDYLLGNTDDPRPAADRATGQKETPTPKSESGRLYPENYDKLSPANKEIVDRLIADLVKNQSSG